MAISPDGLAAYLKGDDPQGSLDAAVEAIRVYCGWHIAPERTEEVPAWSDGSWMTFVPSLRLLEVVSATDWDGRVIDMTNVRWRPYGGISGLPWSGDLKVTIRHGYTDWPADLAAAIYGLAGRSSTSPLGGGASYQVGQVSEQNNVSASLVGAGAFSAAERAVLDAYKLPPRP